VDELCVGEEDGPSWNDKRNVSASCEEKLRRNRVRALYACLLVSVVHILSGSTVAPTFGQGTGKTSGGRPVNSITISAFRDSVKTRSPVYITVEFRNNTDHDLEFARVLSGADCKIDVRDVQGKLPPETGFGYIHNGHVAHPEEDLTRFSGKDLNDEGVWAAVKAGQTTEWVINAAKFYDMRQPGKYAIRVEREDPEDSKVILKSNTVTVTMIP
jgi:hypothetical protein